MTDLLTSVTHNLIDLTLCIITNKGFVAGMIMCAPVIIVSMGV